MEPSTKRTTFPAPHRNFPTPFRSSRRDTGWHTLIGDVNIIHERLKGHGYNMFMGGQPMTDLNVLLKTKEFIQKHSIPTLFQALDRVEPDQNDNQTETPCSGTRDVLVNIGA